MVLLTTLNSKYIHTSLALYSLQTYCRRDFPSIQVKEFNINQDLGGILGAIYQTHPSILGFSTNIWNIIPSLELVERVKKVMPETVVMLGGPEASADFATILRQPAAPDYIVCGEGEETLRQLLKYLKTGEPEPAVINGLAYKDGDLVVATPPREPLDLEEISFPYPDPASLRHRLVYYESSRGCPFHCAYCLSGWEDSTLRYLPVERVKADLTRFIEAGVRTVKLVDRTFNLHRRRTMELMEFLAQQDGATEFHLEMVGELIDEQIIKILKEAPPGRFRVEIGVQSTCPAALEAVNRRYDLGRLGRNCAALTRIPGLTVHLDLIAGLPYEDLTTFARSFDWTFRLRPAELQLGFLKLLKGSPLRTQAEEYGYRFTATPPYEILQSKWLSYPEILHLKAVEVMVEKFYNSQHFHYTLSYLLRAESVSPWRFFSALARFGAEQALTGEGQKEAAYFNGLWRFLHSEAANGPLYNLELIRDLLTLDFYLYGGGGQPPEWLTQEAPALRSTVQSIFREEDWLAKLGLPLKIKPAQLRRRMITLTLKVDPETLTEEETPVLIYRPAQGRPSWFRLPAALSTRPASGVTSSLGGGAAHE